MDNFSSISKSPTEAAKRAVGNFILGCAIAYAAERVLGASPFQYLLNPLGMLDTGIYMPQYVLMGLGNGLSSVVNDVAHLAILGSESHLNRGDTAQSMILAMSVSVGVSIGAIIALAPSSLDVIGTSAGPSWVELVGTALGTEYASQTAYSTLSQLV